MNIVISSPHHLPSMIDRAAQALLNAKSSAEVLEARDMAGHVYDVAKRTARLAKAKDAHDSLIAAAHRAQADALDIEAQAKRRLADEYDAAQERGEVAKLGTNQSDLGVSEQNTRPATTSDLGISRKDIHEARRIRDAEKADPGIVRRTLDEKLSSGQEPTRTALREAVTAAALRGLQPERAPSRKNPLYVPPTKAGAAWDHLHGDCRLMIEWATEENIRLAIEGMRAASYDQSDNISVVLEWASLLHDIAERIDAE